jgi:hemerythrin-like metal-binding protein
MPLLEWRDEFKTGNPSVDHEHRELIELINELHEKLRRTSRNTGEISDYLGEIYAQISAHFALEERLMKEKEYADYPEHKADHDRLLNGIGDIMDDYDSGSFDDMEEELSKRLQNWFATHFSTLDVKLHALLGH